MTKLSFCNFKNNFGETPAYSNLLINDISAIIEM